MLRVFISLIVTLLFAGTSHSQEFNGQERTWVFEATTIATIDLDNSSGVTLVQSETSRSQIEVHIKKVDWNEENCMVAVQNDEGELEVLIANGSWFSMATCQANLTVKLPEQRDVKVETGSGPLRMQGTFDAVHFATGSASAMVEGQIGDVVGEAGSGHTELKGLTGSVNFTGGSGGVEMHFVAVSADSVVNIKTGSGSATIFVPEGMTVDPQFEGGSGLVVNETKKDGEPVSNNPGSETKRLKVSMQAGSGSLTVKPSRGM